MGRVFKLSESWGKLCTGDRLILYGAGRIGRRVLPTLMKEFTIPYLIDQRSIGEKIFGLDVFALDTAAVRLKEENIKVVVTTVRSVYEEIAAQLQEIGLREYEDFCIFERFAGEWNLRWNNRTVLSKIDTVITSRCTLKCRNCNMFIGYAARQCDMSLENLKRNFDIFFDSVDFVYEYTLLGGEPFLHKNLTQIISYLGDTYGKRIGVLNLISNGTVIPSSDVIKTLMRYHVMVHISDYTRVLHYESRLESVTKLFSEMGIEYYVIPNNLWKDVVYPKPGYETTEPRKHMLSCGHSTHSVDNGKLYWCDPAFAAECFVGFPSRSDDSLDLMENKKGYSRYEASLNILQYLLGDVNERGYMSLCEKCAGVGTDNHRIVPAGIQVKENIA